MNFGPGQVYTVGLIVSAQAISLFGESDLRIFRRKEILTQKYH